MGMGRRRRVKVKIRSRQRSQNENFLFGHSFFASFAFVFVVSFILAGKKGVLDIVLREEGTHPPKNLLLRAFTPRIST